MGPKTKAKIKEVQRLDKEGLKTKEIAKRLGESPGYIYALRNRGKKTKATKGLETPPIKKYKSGTDGKEYPLWGCTGHKSKGCSNCRMDIVNSRNHRSSGLTYDLSRVKEKISKFPNEILWTTGGEIGDFSTNEQRGIIAHMIAHSEGKFGILTKVPEPIVRILNDEWGGSLPKHIILAVSVETPKYLDRLEVIRHINGILELWIKPALEVFPEDTDLTNISCIRFAGERHRNGRGLTGRTTKEIENSIRRLGDRWLIPCINCDNRR